VCVCARVCVSAAESVQGLLQHSSSQVEVGAGVCVAKRDKALIEVPSHGRAVCPPPPPPPPRHIVVEQHTAAGFRPLGLQVHARPRTRRERHLTSTREPDQRACRPRSAASLPVLDPVK
jgi:hypothetical protein